MRDYRLNGLKNLLHIQLNLSVEIKKKNVFEKECQMGQYILMDLD
jgi:hypothetical protein